MERQPDSDKTQVRVWCVIPVYNSAAAAIRTARACRARTSRVLVVDDGSTDADLCLLLRDSGIAAVRHERNEGKGRALLTALDYVIRKGGTHLLTLDGDGQHLADDLPVLLAAIHAEPEATLVIGCRDFHTAHVPGSSRFGRRFSNFWVRVETGADLDDTQSGYRAYPAALLSRLHLSTTRYDFEIEALVRALWAGARVREVPVRVVYPPPGQRISHFRPVADNARLALTHARLVGRRMTPWPHKRLVSNGAQLSRMLLRHPVRGLKFLLREHATPEGLAAAAAVGSMLAVLPLVGFHTVAILYAATRLHLNKCMAFAIQHLYIPPFVPFLCIQVGFFMRHGRWWTDFSRATLWHEIHLRLYEWFLGSLVLAPLYAAVAAAATFLAARAVQRHMNRRGET